MNFDLTITISVILALSAILSPIFVAIINNKYQLKLKKIENNEIAKRNAFEYFTKMSGEFIAIPRAASEINMTNALYGLIPYFNIDFISIKSIVDNSENKQKVMEEINNLFKELKKQL